MTTDRSTAHPVEHPGAQVESKTVAANYQYWQEHGGSWAAEYDARKRDQVYYHIQEILLTEYIRQQAPARVLDPAARAVSSSRDRSGPSPGRTSTASTPR